MKTKLSLSAIALAIFFVGCSKDDLPEVEKKVEEKEEIDTPITIIEEEEEVNKIENTAFFQFKEDANYSSLYLLADKAEIADQIIEIEAKGGFTLMAPNNEKINEFLASKNKSLENITKEDAENIILYHIIPEKLTNEKLIRANSFESPDNSEGVWFYETSYHSTLLKSEFGENLSLLIFGEQKWGAEENKGKIFVNSAWGLDQINSDFDYELPLVNIDENTITDKGDKLNFVPITDVLVPLSLTQFFLVDRVNNSDRAKGMMTDKVKSNLGDDIKVTVFFPHRAAADRLGFFELFGLQSKMDAIFSYSTAKKVSLLENFDKQIETNYKGQKITVDTNEEGEIILKSTSDRNAKIMIKNIVATNGVLNYIDNFLIPTI